MAHIIWQVLKLLIKTTNRIKPDERQQSPHTHQRKKHDTSPEGAWGTPRKTPKTGPLIETIDKTIALLHETPQKCGLCTTKNVVHLRR